MMKRNTILATACLAGALVLGMSGCESTQSSSSSGTAANMGVINETCPLMGGPVKAEAGTVTYAGHEIGFCCAGCVEDWNKMSDDEKQAYVDSQLKANMGVVGSTTKDKGGCCSDAGACDGGSCDSGN